MAAVRTPDDQIRREARSSGLHARDVLPSLAAVERRRRQLWFTVLVVVLLCLAGVTLLSVATMELEPDAVASRSTLACSLLAVTFGIYAADKELHLRRLRRLLSHERGRSAVLAQQVYDYAMVLEASKALGSVLGLADVVNQTLVSAVEMVAANGGTMHLADGADQLTVAGAIGAQAEPGLPLRIGQGLAGRAASTREAQLVDLLPHAGVPGAGRAIAVPLLCGDDLIGVLTLVGPELDERAMHASNLFAEQAAVSLDHGRRYELQRRRVTRLFDDELLRAGQLGSGRHDLRTPLTSIISCSRMARRGDLPADERADILALMETQSHKLATMVEDLITGLTVGTPRPVNLSALVTEAAARHRVAGRQLSVHAAQACVAVVDATAVERILDHLVDNAFRFGSAPVQVGVRRHGTEVLLSVWDQGKGIPADDRDRIFDADVQLNDTSGSLGLGLSIVRRLVDQAGGKVWADEAPGGGAAVHVSLPAVVTESTPTYARR